jgi:hypothetical protein
MTVNVPDQPGRVLINHWTDGNPHFSGAPIEDGGDADLHIAHMNMFFNTSDSPNQTLACQKSKRPCKVEGNLKKKNIFCNMALFTYHLSI